MIIMKKVFILFSCFFLLLSCEQTEIETEVFNNPVNQTQKNTSKISSKTRSCTGVLNGFFNLCGYDRHGDQIEYNVYLTNLSKGEITGMPTWRSSTSQVQIVSTSRYSCKVRLKYKKDLAKFITTATIEARTDKCSYPVPISIRNCRDYNYSD